MGEPFVGKIVFKMPDAYFIDPSKYDLSGVTFHPVYFVCCEALVLVARQNERMHCPHCGKPAEPVQM